VRQGRDVDLLFGLDMLKAHQACIDLERNVLRIQGREVKFLSEHELPDKARISETPATSAHAPDSSSPRHSSSMPRTTQAATPTSGASAPSRPTSTSGSSTNAPSRQSPHGQTSRTQATAHSEAAIAALMGLGASRLEAIRSLDAAGGNVDVAASLLF
jgi:DNA damage-inducible protein 1